MALTKPPRLAVRAVLIHENRLLLVNAWPDGKSDLLCAPGGGVEPHSSLPDNLKREVFEETGLRIDVGPLCLVNEFHDPKRGFHQVELFFRCTVTDPTLTAGWVDPEQIVTDRRWVSQSELQDLWVKPDTLKSMAFSQSPTPLYDPLETIVQ